jgi:hypothetical protein
MGLYHLDEASEKKQYIEIWLGHLTVSVDFVLFFHATVLMTLNLRKSSAMSSCSSLQSTSPSASSAVKPHTTAVGHGIKRNKKGASALVRPLKRAKHALSSVSSPVGSDNEGTTTDDQSSIKVITILSDGEELGDLEKELGMFLSSFSLPFHSLLFVVAAKETWQSPIYAFFKSEVTIQLHKGRVAHFFACAAKKCKTDARGVRRYQDKGDKSSTANLRHHAVHCFGKDAVDATLTGNGDAASSRSGSIFSAFARQGQRTVTYSHRAHSTPEFRYVHNHSEYHH